MNVVLLIMLFIYTLGHNLVNSPVPLPVALIVATRRASVGDPVVLGLKLAVNQ